MNFSRIMFSVSVFSIALLIGFKVGERIDLIENLIRFSLDSAAVPEVFAPNHDQFNLLIIGLTDEQNPEAELQSIWLAAYSKKTHNMTFMPIFPAENEPVRNQRLAEAFELEHGKPNKAFWKELRSTHLWWEGYIVTDRNATIEIIDLLDGIYVDDHLWDGSQYVNSISPWEGDPHTAVRQQKTLLEGICNRLAQTEPPTATPNWKMLFDQRNHTNFQTALQVISWGSKFHELGDFSCQFPTFRETPIP